MKILWQFNIKISEMSTRISYDATAMMGVIIMQTKK